MSQDLTKLQRVSIALLSVVVFFTATIGFVSAWWLYGPTSEDFAPALPEKHYARYENDVLVINRAAIARKPMHLKITRDLRRVDTPQQFGYAMPTLELFTNGADGTKTIERAVPLPDLPPGKYQLQSYVEWPANPLRTVVTPLPVVTFEVKR